MLTFVLAICKAPWRRRTSGHTLSARSVLAFWHMRLHGQCAWMIRGNVQVALAVPGHAVRRYTGALQDSLAFWTLRPSYMIPCRGGARKGNHGFHSYIIMGFICSIGSNFYWIWWFLLSSSEPNACLYCSSAPDPMCKKDLSSLHRECA